MLWNQNRVKMIPMSRKKTPTCQIKTRIAALVSKIAMRALLRLKKFAKSILRAIQEK